VGGTCLASLDTPLSFLNGGLGLLAQVFDVVQYDLGLLTEFFKEVSGHRNRLSQGLSALAT